MDIASTFRTKTLPFLAVLLLTLLSFRSAPAATHIIIFGGEVGFTYSPSTLNVAVGDVITFQGDFTMHPLHFETVPEGAEKPANVTSGDNFSYTVTVAGKYDYFCLAHCSFGMTGTFTAEGSAGVDRSVDVAMLRVVENPVHQDSPLVVELGFDVAKLKQVNLCTSDGLCGMFVKGGGYHVEGNRLVIPNTSWGAGAFVLSIVTDDATYRRKLIITR